MLNVAEASVISPVGVTGEVSAQIEWGGGSGYAIVSASSQANATPDWTLQLRHDNTALSDFAEIDGSNKTQYTIGYSFILPPGPISIVLNSLEIANEAGAGLVVYNNPV